MEVSIKTKELVFGIKKISEAELATLFPKESDRYKIATGSEKDDILYRSIESAKAEIDAEIARFLILGDDLRDLIVDAPVSGKYLPDYIVWNFRDCKRRIGKQQAVTTFCYDYLVQGALTHFYESVGAVDAAEIHRKKSLEVASNLVTTLLRKNAPIVD